MKHSEMINEIKNISCKDFNKVVEIKKSYSSGNRLLNVLFLSEEDRDSFRLKYFPNSSKCEKRYGWGIMICDWHFPKPFTLK